MKVTIGEERSCVDSNFRGIQSNYGQTEDGKNALVVADGDDGENSPAMLIQGDDRTCELRRMDLRGYNVRIGEERWSVGSR